MQSILFNLLMSSIPKNLMAKNSDIAWLASEYRENSGPAS